MLEINEEQFQEKVINADKGVAVIFTAPWCGFCDSMMKVSQAVAKELPDVHVFKVDSGLCRELAAKYTVSTVPTTIVFSGGTIKERKTGLLKKSELYNMLLKVSSLKKTPV